MDITFYKYQATGNDFIIIDHLTRPETVPYDPALIQALCHRRFGIGADGIIFLRRKEAYAFEMLFFNPDATQSFCGNGSRCAIHWAYQRGLVGKAATFLAIDGAHTAAVSNEEVRISLHSVGDITQYHQDYFLETGSPHYVRLVDTLVGLAVDELGKAINSYEIFQERGTNVNFVKLEANNRIAIRTYERGVYAETWSCGTGAVASALVAAQQGYRSPVEVITPGGKLTVEFVEEAASFSQIYLSGPAMQVFQGYIHQLPPSISNNNTFERTPL
jgi:diaminopimelate epimerase